MHCPFLEYRNEDENQLFDKERAYCTITDQFVEPMRSDICNNRYSMKHDSHCEIFQQYSSEGNLNSTKNKEK